MPTPIITSVLVLSLPSANYWAYRHIVTPLPAILAAFYPSVGTALSPILYPHGGVSAHLHTTHTILLFSQLIRIIAFALQIFEVRIQGNSIFLAVEVADSAGDQVGLLLSYSIEKQPKLANLAAPAVGKGHHFITVAGACPITQSLAVPLHSAPLSSGTVVQHEQGSHTSQQLVLQQFADTFHNPFADHLHLADVQEAMPLPAYQALPYCPVAVRLCVSEVLGARCDAGFQLLKELLAMLPELPEHCLHLQPHLLPQTGAVLVQQRFGPAPALDQQLLQRLAAIPTSAHATTHITIIPIVRSICMLPFSIVSLFLSVGYNTPSAGALSWGWPAMRLEWDEGLSQQILAPFHPPSLSSNFIQYPFLYYNTFMGVQAHMRINAL